MTSEKIKTCHTMHRQAIAVAAELASQEFQMIECLQTIERDHVFKFFGFKSLFQYSVLALGLSEDRAYNLILVSRKASQIEKLQLALKNRKITLSKAKRISSVITTENAEEWLEKASSFSQRDLEQLVAKVNPKAGVQEGSHFISETMLEFKAAISLDTERAIKRAQDLLCQSHGKVVSLDDTLYAMAQLFLDKKDPVHKAARVIKRKIRKEASKDKVMFSNGKRSQQQKSQPDQRQTTKNSRVFGRIRRPLTAKVKHEVALRDRGQCQATTRNGTTCSDGRWVDLHHVKPVAEGGQNIIENLITLCHTHHKMHHDDFTMRPPK